MKCFWLQWLCWRMPGLAIIQNDVPYTQEFLFRNEEGCEAEEKRERAV